MKVPPRFRLLVAIIACTVVHKGRADCNSLIEAATPIFTNKMPKGDDDTEEDEKSQPSPVKEKTK